MRIDGSPTRRVCSPIPVGVRSSRHDRDTKGLHRLPPAPISSHSDSANRALAATSAVRLRAGCATTSRSNVVGHRRSSINERQSIRLTHETVPAPLRRGRKSAARSSVLVGIPRSRLRSQLVVERSQRLDTTSRRCYSRTSPVGPCRDPLKRRNLMRAVSAAIAAALPDAASVFADRGLDGTRMEDIVRATGVPRPTLYYHFASKNEILAWLLDRLLADLSRDLGRVLDRDEPAARRLDAVIGTYLSLFAEHRDLCTVLLSELGRISRIPELADAIRAAFHEPVRKLLDAGARDGSLRSVDEELAASAIFGAITMVGLHKIVTDQPVDVPRTSSVLSELMTVGLAPDARGKQTRGSE